MKNIMFRTRVWVIPAAVFVLGTVFSPALDAKIVIAKGGRAAAQVVVASDAGDTEKYAAWRLGFFLHLVTDGDFPVTTETDTVSERPYRLLVGEGAVRLAEPDFRSSVLQSEEIVIRSRGNDLILAGGSPRGTLYAVFTFLEDVVGLVRSLETIALRRRALRPLCAPIRIPRALLVRRLRSPMVGVEQSQRHQGGRR